MSPMFGHQADGADGAAALQAEIDRAGVLPLPELAAEVMARAFGPDGPGGPGRPGTIDGPAEASNRLTLTDVARAFTPAFAARGAGADQLHRLSLLLAEALQLLEHAALVRVSWRGGMENYLATRAGRAAVAQGAVTRVLAGGGR